MEIEVKRLNELIVTLFNNIKNISDEGREYPIMWNIMHMFSSSQLAKLLALRRGINVELSSIAALLHDIAVIITKKSEGHAEKAEEYVLDVINKHNNEVLDDSLRISKEEELILVRAIVNHSDKTSYSDEPFVELLKDIDLVDRFLHGIKTEGIYLDRCRRVFKELCIDEQNIFFES